VGVRSRRGAVVRIAHRVEPIGADGHLGCTVCIECISRLGSTGYQSGALAAGRRLVAQIRFP
jgi:hypothetical protein